MLTHARIASGNGLVALGITLGAAVSTAIASSETHVDATLRGQVQAFFRAENQKARDALLSSISDAAGTRIQQVAQALKSVELWTKLPKRRGVFAFTSGAYGTLSIAYSLPEGYDPATKYPLVLCMPDAHASPEETVEDAARLLGHHAGELALVCPERRIGGSFSDAPIAAGDLRRLVRLTRKHIHIDSDRTYLLGLGAGGDGVWMVSITHADLFAGAIALFGYPRVPYPEQAYPMLLENLRQVGVLTVWLAPDDPWATGQQKVAAAHNRGIIEFARAVSLPISGVELPSGQMPVLPEGEVSRVIDRRRPGPGKQVSHWFRYPEHGRTIWLRQTRPAGEPWYADQLAILPAPATDAHEFVRQVLRANFGYLGGHINGQTVEIEARGCAGVELLLYDGMIDFSLPVVVVCNGRKRYEGLMRPSIKTLLEFAYDEWEFQHPAWLRLPISIGPPSRPGSGTRP
ncbi:MAG: hypothetical protein ACE5HE_09215 [Phycisphaerae bacterium]